MREPFVARVGMSALCAVVLLSIQGCATARLHIAGARPRIAESTTHVVLYGTPLELHMAVPLTPAVPHVLVIYASGDGGWFGTAVDMFRAIADAGYATVGLSSRAFLRIERPVKGRSSVTRLAAEYDQIADRARAALGLDGTTRVVLTGWSRGAAFSVLVGSEPIEKDHVLGVVAIGLPEAEDLSINGAEDETDDGPTPQTPKTRRPSARKFDTYRRIRRLASLPCAVIQATHDNYLPAANARQLFGGDTSSRRFYTIEARNHRFTGGVPAFDAALVDAMQWVVSVHGR